MSAVPSELVRAELARILASGLVARSERLCQLLRFVIEESLQGRADGLKETTIGVTVFGRPPDWNPRIDSVVRMNAGRLRDKLREYYATEGQNALVIIEIPKGSYVPRWQRRAAEPRSWRRPAFLASSLASAALLMVLLLPAGLRPTQSSASARHVKPIDGRAGWRVTIAAAGFTARFDHTATVLRNGKVLLAGGVNSTDGKKVALSSALLFDPASDSFSSTGQLRHARGNHTATLLNDGRVLVIGGYTVLSDGRTQEALATAEIYDPATGMFTAAGTLDAPRRGHTATLLMDGRVLICGGMLANFKQKLSSAEIFDPTIGRFGRTASLNQPRAYFTATRLADGNVLIAGGQPVFEIYDPAAATFRIIEDRPVRRMHHTATLLRSGNVLLLGGRSYGNPQGLSSAQILNTAQQRFQAPLETLRGRCLHTSTLLSDGRVLTAGGDDSGSALSSAEIYDPASGTFSATVRMTVSRSRHSATRLSDDRILFAGGIGGTDTAEIFTPTNEPTISNR